MAKKWKNFSSRLVKIIKQSKRIVIGTHIDPDSDGICAALSTAALVKHYKKTKPLLYCHSPVPSKHNFLLKGCRFHNKLPDFDLLIAVDSTDLARVIPLQEQKKTDFSKKSIINIDHHKSNTRFGNLTYVDENASSACEIIYRLFNRLRIRLTRPVAEILYSGLYIETGGFVYPNTTKEALNTAAELVKTGVQPSPLVKRLHARTIQGTKLLSAALNTIEIKKGVGYMYVTQAMLKRHHADMMDSEHFISFLQAIKGVRIAVFLREEKDGTRISLRSDGAIDVNEVAKKFGGGGHRLAAGTRIETGIRAAKRKIARAILAAIKRHSGLIHSGI